MSDKETDRLAAVDITDNHAGASQTFDMSIDENKKLNKDQDASQTALEDR